MELRFCLYNNYNLQDDKKPGGLIQKLIQIDKEY